MSLAIVAPLVGAWIEIVPSPSPATIATVAPLVGAWIEIVQSCSQFLILEVAPLVGAWIEIKIAHRRAAAVSGRSPRGSVD